MADQTKIQWADATWNPVTGCTPVSEGCAHCYAERMARRFNLSDLRDGESVSVENYFAPRFHPNRLDIPLHWRKPRRVFVCSMGDLFHEAITHTQQLQVLNLAHECPQHSFMVLTKRPERMRDTICSIADDGPLLPNLWLGVTVENQARADERIPILLDTPAAVRFVSVEPMLGPVDLWEVRHWCEHCQTTHSSLSCFQQAPARSKPWLDWLILGGETGPGARPMQPQWALDVWRQCKAAGVPFFWKQGSNGIEYDPEMVTTREHPEEVWTYRKNC